jgi:hypothetical protein
MHGYRRTGLVAFAAGALLLATAVLSPAAQALTRTGAHPNAGGGIDTVKAIDVTTVTNADDYNAILARCHNPGGTCSITEEKSFSTQIGLSLGVTKSIAAAALNFSVSASSSTSVSCSHAKMPADDDFEAFPVGTWKTYKLKVTTPDGSQTSGWLRAFEPRSYQSIDCELVAD